MSRLDPKVAEENRLAYIRNEAQANREEAVAKWLQDNPTIGVLNGGKYYKIVDGKTVYVKEFAI